MPKVNIIPRGKYVLVQPEEKPKHVNEQCLIIPESVEQERKAQGQVIHAGASSDLKKGDKVVYGEFSGETMIVEEKGKKVEYRLVHDEDIIAVIR